MDKKRVMVVDDEQDLLELTKLTLEGTGRYEVLTLTNAKDIIDNLHRFKPDIILLDIRMPMVDGLEACQMLNNDPIGKSVPIIILSVMDSDKDRLNAFKVGVVDYLSKSAKKEELIASIEKALQCK